MTPSLHPRTPLGLLFALLFTFSIQGYAADPIATAEAAIERFRTACDGEISKTTVPGTLKTIRAMRESPFLMIALKSHVDVTEFLDPQFAAALEKSGLYGSRNALTQSTGNVWVLTYGNMKSMVVYLDATSGAVLCVAFIPEG